MPTANPRFTITLSDDLKGRVDDYKFSNRMGNQTQAIVSLIERGLAKLENESTEKEMSPASEDAGDDEITVEEMEKFLISMGFIRDGRKLTEKDFKFLRGIFDMLDAWFS